MTESSSSTTDWRDIALQKLLSRRDSLQATYDQLIKEPASYSVSGAVSASNRNLAEIREELNRVVAQIANLLKGEKGGVRRSYPNYRIDPRGRL